MQHFIKVLFKSFRGAVYDGATHPTLEETTEARQSPQNTS
jgi:hypothetical protein